MVFTSGQRKEDMARRDVVGEPLLFDAYTDHAAATTRLEAAVAAL